MAPEETDPMREVVGWLERLSAIRLPRLKHGDSLAELNTQWLRNLLSWCDALGLGYPACFIEPAGPPRHRTISTACATVHAIRSTPRRTRNFATERPSGGRWQSQKQSWRYWRDNPATMAYRGMLRHLRRHVTRGAEAHAIDFLSNPDPLRIASLMRSSRTAMFAFAEMVWSERMELEVMRRRWPYRRIAQELGGYYVGCIEPPSIAYDDGLGDGVFEETYVWIEYQACEALMLSRWREAQRLALASVRSGIADWRPTSDGDAFSWVTTHEADTLRFVCLERQTGFDWTLPLPDKPRRCEAWLANETLKRQRLGVECTGPCLSWSARDGWIVEESLAPTCASVAHHRLLGVSGVRPKFLLFVSGDVFVARARAIKLQVRAVTPKDAIEGLRLAMRQHQRTYPSVLAEQPPPLVRPQPVRDLARREFELRLACVRRDYGFWRGACLFHSVTTDFLEENQRREADWQA